MKLVEKYLAAVGSKLPLKAREDVKAELRSLILDDIEAKYGPEPRDEEIRGTIAEFGSPGAVAARYAGTRQVIGTGFTDLYFLVISILFGALAIAFTTIFLVELIQEPLSGWPLPQAILRIPLQVLSSGLNGMGVVTVIFIIMTRVAKDQPDVMEEGWSVNDLDEVKLEDELESRLESILSLVFQGVMVVVLVAFPGIVSAAEWLFSLSELPLGHTLVVPVFRWYALGLALLTLGEMANSLTALKAGARGPRLRLADTILSGANALLLLIMLLDSRLYADNTGWIGFKMVFGIILVISTIELVSGGVKALRSRIAGQAPHHV